MKLSIDITPFEKTLNSLKMVLALKEDDVVRDSCIQRFEYTYGLCIKFMQRQLENMVVAAEEIDQMAFPDLIRTAAEKGLIEDPVEWFEYRKKRNITSHTYDEEKAEAVYSVLHDFAKSAEYLLNSIKRLNQ